MKGRVEYGVKETEYGGYIPSIYIEDDKVGMVEFTSNVELFSEEESERFLAAVYSILSGPQKNLKMNTNWAEK